MSKSIKKCSIKSLTTTEKEKRSTQFQQAEHRFLIIFKDIDAAVDRHQVLLMVEYLFPSLTKNTLTCLTLGKIQFSTH